MLLEIIEKIADEIIKNKEYLTELDRVIGDGDHGVNLARGFEEIKAQLPTYSSLEYSDIFQKMGMALLTKVGGASGAIYGTAFMSAGMYCKDRKSTRLNSSHANISYAVFCLKKKTIAHVLHSVCHT